MKKRALLMVPALILGSSLLIGAGTYALFSANTTNSGNAFTAGTLNIRLDHQDTDKPYVAYFNVQNMAPGDSQVEPVTISSTGSLALIYNMSVTLGGFLGTNDGNHLTYAVYPTLNDANAGTNAVDLNQYRPLDAKGGLHDHETLYVKISLPLAANNDYENQSGTAVISVNAVQQKNNDGFSTQNWVASGPGTTSVTYGVPNPNSVKFNYDDGQSSAQYNGQEWNFTNTTTATKSETIDFNYDYSGLHSWYDANAYVKVFVNGPNGQTVKTLWSSSVFGNFDNSGSASIQVNQGYTYGFIVGGSNFDYSQIMEGQLTVTRTN